MPGFTALAYSDSVGSKHRGGTRRGTQTPERGLCVRSLRGAGGGVYSMVVVGVVVEVASGVPGSGE